MREHIQQGANNVIAGVPRVAHALPGAAARTYQVVRSAPTTISTAVRMTGSTAQSYSGNAARMIRSAAHLQFFDKPKPKW